MLSRPFFKILSCYLIIAVFALTLPAPGWAMLLPAGHAVERSTDQAKVKTALESSVIKQRLMDFGLTPEETTARIGKLTDEQLHRLASNLDSVQAGGDVLGDVVVILLIVILVIAVLELTGHHVIMKR
jgi:hypothetical protein